MKIAIIGAGNVGSTSAMRIAESGLADIVLVDIAPGLAKAKALDIQDAQAALGSNYRIQGSEDISVIRGSDIVVLSAGLARKPGMTREELLHKNSAILKEISLNIKKLAPQAIVIVVTNPLDLMTYFVLKTCAFNFTKVFGMGPSLDASRFANLISEELNIPVTDIQACVIASHGEGMLPLPRLTTIKGTELTELLSEEKISSLVKKTLNRGAEIVSLLGSGSAYFAPAAAIAAIVKNITEGRKQTLPVCAYFNGEYGIKDICLGAPCILGKNGIEKIIQLDLNQAEKEKLAASAESIRQSLKQLPL